MTKYLIKSNTEVFEDNYIDGEGRCVNWHDAKSEINAENPLQAINNYIEKVLCWTNGTLDLDCEEPVYVNVVDADNCGVGEGNNEWEQFKNGEIKLYNSYTRFKIYQLTEINLI